MQKIVFSLDDYCWQYRDCREYLNKLKDYFINFKCSFFTIPAYEGILLSEHKEILDFDYPVEHLLHGYMHTNHEFKDLMGEKMVLRLSFGQDEFKKCNIKPRKIFKAPNWRYNDSLVDAMIMWNWTLAIYSPGYRVRGLKVYEYNWDIGDPKIPGDAIIHAHGHTHYVSGPGKGIDNPEVVENIMQLPKDIEFMLISDFLSSNLE